MSAISQEQHVLSLPPTDRVEHFHLSRSHSVVSWNDGIAVWFSFEFFCLFYFSSQEIILSIILCVRVFYWHCLRKIDTLQTCTEVDKILCSVSGNVINITWHVLFLTSDGPSSLRHCWRPLKKMTIYLLLFQTLAKLFSFQWPSIYRSSGRL